MLQAQQPPPRAVGRHRDAPEPRGAREGRADGGALADERDRPLLEERPVRPAGGVLELAAPAVAALRAAGRPFTVGVQTDAPDIAGGTDRTFFDEGPVALIRESGVVAEALREVPGFEGVAVKAHRAWRRLLGV